MTKPYQTLTPAQEDAWGKERTLDLTSLFKNWTDLSRYVLQRKFEAEADRRFSTVVHINPNELEPMRLFGMHVVWDTSVNQPVVGSDLATDATTRSAPVQEHGR